MPNLWTKTTQKIQEAFNGPRTKDTEFDLKMDEMKLVEKGVLSLKQVFQNFLNYTVSIRTLCRDVASSVKNVYDKQSPYSVIGHDITDAHVELERFYDEFYNNVNKLSLRTTEWGKLFDQAKVQIEKRMKSRKNYDHYDEKIEKVYKERQEKANKKSTESQKDIEFLQRNEEKYKKATEEYVKLSESTYETVQAILDKRYDIVNPIVEEFLNEEKIFFGNATNIFKKFDGLSKRLRNISCTVKKTPITYDPCKYIRGGEIIQREKKEEINNNNNNNNRNENVQRNAPNRGSQEVDMRDRSRTNVNRNNFDNSYSDYNNNNNNNSNMNNQNMNNQNMNNQNMNNSFNRYEQRGEQNYPEFSGINDNFSNMNIQNRHANSMYIPHNQNSNNLNNFNQKMPQQQQQQNYNQNNFNDQQNQFSVFDNNNFNDFDFNFNNSNKARNTISITSGIPAMNDVMSVNSIQNRNSNSDFNQNNNNRSSLNNNNNNKNQNNTQDFNFDNIFSNVGSGNSAPIYGNTSISKNITSSNIQMAGQAMNTFSNFNFNAPPQGNRNSNINNNPKNSKQDDIFKDLF